MRKFGKIHILLFSEKTQETRRLSLTRVALLACLFLGAVAAVAILASAWGVTYYYARFQQASHTLEKNLVVADRREKILSEFASLEKEVDRREKLANELASALRIDTEELQTGRGPLPRDEDKDLAMRVAAFPMDQHLEELSESGTPDEKGLWGATAEEDHFLRDLWDRLFSLRGRQQSLEYRLEQLQRLAQEKAKYYLTLPARWPVKGLITSGFGFRHSPMGGATSFHEGVDIASPVGTIVTSPSEGTVVWSGWRGGYGNSVVIDHGFGIQTVYGHNSQVFVQAGEKVSQGTQVAMVGRTGRATGPHLHYEVRVDGVPVDPLNFIDDILE